MNPLITPAVGWIVQLPFFYKYCFGIELPIKVIMPFNKETNQLNKQTTADNVSV